MQPTDKFYIQSINRALTLVEKISGGLGDGILLTELAALAGMPLSTAYRILQNLVAWEYVEEGQDGRYRLGPTLTRLGMQRYRELDVREAARGELEALADRCSQTVYMAKLDIKAASIQYVTKIRAKGSIQLSADVGTLNHIHSTANGKVLVGDLSDGEILALLELGGMSKLTERTVTDPAEYLRQVAAARKDGYALDLEENEDNVVCVAAPVRDAAGRIAASVSISGVAGVTLDVKNLSDAIRMVRDAVARITGAMT